jgi:hypothetical protein
MYALLRKVSDTTWAIGATGDYVGDMADNGCSIRRSRRRNDGISQPGAAQRFPDSAKRIFSVFWDGPLNIYAHRTCVGPDKRPALSVTGARRTSAVGRLR